MKRCRTSEHFHFASSPKTREKLDMKLSRIHSQAKVMFLLTKIYKLNFSKLDQEY